MTIKTKNEIIIEDFARRVAELVRIELANASKTCLTCEHFDKRSETCNLNRMRPPAEIIAYGCECYLEEIPF